MPIFILLSVVICMFGWLRVSLAESKPLNNLVSELNSVVVSSPDDLSNVQFENPRDGWIFISAQAEASAAEVHAKFAGADRAPIVLRQTRDPHAVEAMIYLPAGKHMFALTTADSASFKHVTIRAIPEILYAEAGYVLSPYLKNYGPYRMEYLKRIGMLDNLNVLISRDPLPEDAILLKEWRDSGKRVIEYSNLLWMNAVDGNPLHAWKSDWAKAVQSGAYYDYWSQRLGMNDDGYFGIIVDEVDANYSGLRTEQTASLKQLLEDPRFSDKHFYAYSVRLFQPEFNPPFVKTLLSFPNSKLVEEIYSAEPSSEQDAIVQLDENVRQRVAGYKKMFPGSERQLILNLGYFNSPPESLNTNPAIDWRVWMDMQVHLVANDPLFKGIYGIMAYHSFAADDEAQRWVSKLYRHYCIEGKTERLTNDPLMLPHLRNPDFDHGVDGWTASSAEPDSISVKPVEKYAYMQGRVHRDQDCPVLVMKRSSKQPNRISQEVRSLEPGRLYSLKLFTADYGEFVAGKSINQTHPVTIQFDGAEYQPKQSIMEVFDNSAAGHNFETFNADNKFFMTYRCLVFRATKSTGTLTLSDWASDKDPGGPIGQQLMHNFVELQPYLED